MMAADGIDRRTFMFAASLGAFSLLSWRPLGAREYDITGLDALKIDVQAPQLPATPLSMPGLFPARVIEAHHPGVLDARGRASRAAVREMLDRGMRELTGERSAEAAWRRFFDPTDIVGLKVNPSGTPPTTTNIQLVREVIRGLNSAGVPNRNIVVYDRNSTQLEANGYHLFVPPEVRVFGLDYEWVEHGERRGGYDREIFCEMDCFGERETRSYMGWVPARMVTKIINLPVMKEHNASGVTGCLKNLAYGSFNNVARTHVAPKTYTSPVIAVMCASAPVRTKAVLHIMDAIRAVYHSGPFAWNPEFHFEAKSILIGTDPVAMDRIELETVERKRKEVGAPSLWDRNPAHLGSAADMQRTAMKNRFYRQPGHIKIASELGLGQWELDRIDHRRIQVS